MRPYMRADSVRSFAGWTSENRFVLGHRVPYNEGRGVSETVDQEPVFGFLLQVVQVQCPTDGVVSVEFRDWLATPSAFGRPKQEQQQEVE